MTTVTTIIVTTIKFLFEVTITDDLFNFHKLSIRFCGTYFAELCPLSHQNLSLSMEFRDFSDKLSIKTTFIALNDASAT